MFAHSAEIAEPRRIFSGRRARLPYVALRVGVAAAICVAGYALVSVLSV